MAAANMSPDEFWGAPASTPATPPGAPQAASSASPYPNTLPDGATVNLAQQRGVTYQNGTYADAQGNPYAAAGDQGPGYYRNKGGDLFHVVPGQGSGSSTDAPAKGMSPDEFWGNDPATQTPPTPPQKPDFGLGFMQGFDKPLNNAATWASHGLDTVANGLMNVPMIRGANDAIAGFTGLPNSAQSQNAFTNSTNDAISRQGAAMDAAQAQGHSPSGFGQFVGGVVGTLPAFAVTKNPFIGGALGGALDTNDPNSLSSTATSAAVGGVGGKVGDMAAKGLGAIVAPRLSHAVQLLMGEGVQLTPGQILGGTAHRLEDGISHLPVVGDLIKGAQNNSTMTFNRAAINRALTPIGEKLPAGMNAGNEAVEHATTKLSDAYDAILPKLSVTVDAPFAQGLASIAKNATMLPSDQASQFSKIIDEWVRRPLQQTGMTLPGDVMKKSDSEIGRLAAAYSGSAATGERELGKALFAVQGELRTLVTRSNPAEAPALNAINKGWAQLVRIHGASASIGAAGRGGVFTASNLLGASRAADKSVRKSAFAQGNALMQDLAQSGHEVLPSQVNDSGTAGRGLLTGALLSGGHALHMLFNPATGIPLAALSAAYTKPGQSLLRKAIIARPPWAPQARQLLSHIETPSGILGSQLAQPVSQGLLPRPTP